MPPEQRLVPQAALPEPIQSRLRSLVVSDNMIEGILLQLRILRFGLLQDGDVVCVIGGGRAGECGDDPHNRVDESFAVARYRTCRCNRMSVTAGWSKYAR